MDKGKATTITVSGLLQITTRHVRARSVRYTGGRTDGYGHPWFYASLCKERPHVIVLECYKMETHAYCAFTAFESLFQESPTKSNVCYKQDRQCTYERNIETGSRIHCRSGKAISITYSECACVCSLNYSASNAHASYCIVICGPLALPYFYIFLTNGMIFAKKVPGYKTCVLLFSIAFA